MVVEETHHLPRIGENSTKCLGGWVAEKKKNKQLSRRSAWVFGKGVQQKLGVFGGSQ